MFASVIRHKKKWPSTAREGDNKTSLNMLVNLQSNAVISFIWNYLLVRTAIHLRLNSPSLLSSGSVPFHLLYCHSNESIYQDFTKLLETLTHRRRDSIVFLNCFFFVSFFAQSVKRCFISFQAILVLSLHFACANIRKYSQEYVVRLTNP